MEILCGEEAVRNSLEAVSVLTTDYRLMIASGVNAGGLERRSTLSVELTPTKVPLKMFQHFFVDLVAFVAFCRPLLHMLCVSALRLLTRG